MTSTSARHFYREVPLPGGEPQKPKFLKEKHEPKPEFFSEGWRISNQTVRGVWIFSGMTHLKQNKRFFQPKNAILGLKRGK